MIAHTLIVRTKEYYSEHGTAAAALKLLKYPLVSAKRALLLRGSVEDRFTNIHDANWWLSADSKSGEGSELPYTANVRAQLPAIFTTYNVSTVLDAPCGDFHWMRHVIADAEVTYIGGDIVRTLIDRNNDQHGSDRTSFMHLNIISDDLPPADLMITRDCLFHFCYRDVLRFLQNFCDAGIPRLLTTNHIGPEIQNRNIRTGKSRRINLFAEPFFFPGPPILRFDDYIKPHLPREMCLFSREQIYTAINQMEAALNGH